MHSTPKNHLIVLFLLAAGFFIAYALERSSENAVIARAHGFVELCASARNKSLCYEREVLPLLSIVSVEDVFNIIREIRRLDSEYQFCHVLAHKLGEAVVAEDPEHWMEAIPLNPPDGLCSNGFIHGVIGGRFRTEVLDDETLEKLIPDFSRACEPRKGWQPSSLDQAICYHGIGHLYMFVTDADIPKALSLCERTARGSDPERDFRRVCREGVFMQIYQPLEPDDFLLIDRMPLKPSTTTVRQFCARYERDKYEGACLHESWPYFRKEILDGSGIERFCSGQPNLAEDTACYESAFSILGRLSLGKLERAAAACSVVPEERRSMCYERVALAILEEDRSESRRAISFCNDAPTPLQPKCLEFLARIARFNYVPGTPQHRIFCSALPIDFRRGCLRI